MNREELIKKVNTALADEFEVEESVLAPDANIKEALELDSLSLVDLVALIDSEFGVKIPGSDMAKIKTFGALYDALAEKVCGQ